MQLPKGFDRVTKKWNDCFIAIFEQGYIMGQKDALDKARNSLSPTLKRKIDKLVKEEKKGKKK